MQENTVSQFFAAPIGGKSWDLFAKTPHEDDWIRDVQKRADGGSAEDQFQMGAFYEFSSGSLPEDSRKALEWYRKAARQGHVLAKTGLEDLSPSGGTVSESDAMKLAVRRLSRQQRRSSAVINEMDAKAREAIKRIKE